MDEYYEDINKVAEFINEYRKQLSNCRIMVTGGTGLIGSLLINGLLEANDKYGLDCSLNIIVRNYDKAINTFGERIKRHNIITGDIVEANLDRCSRVDYVVHAASNTSSQSFVNEPVETAITNLIGTNNVLKFARENPPKKVIYLSTMEVYGEREENEILDENTYLRLQSINARSSYPLSKAMSENLCNSYSIEYGIPSVILRLTQTFGPGVSYQDKRVFAEFARCAIEGKDIVLHTPGKTKRSYLYTVDAVKAIIMALCIDKMNGVYNVANTKTYCSIREMAELVSKSWGIDVISEIDYSNEYGYAPVTASRMSVSKIHELGWTSTYNLNEMYVRLINYMKVHRGSKCTVLQ